jgi:predicted HD phosphohydrolase
VLTEDGEKEYAWDPGSPAEVRAARERFEHYLKENCIAFIKEPGGKEGIPLSQFDPLAEEIFMLGLAAGG